MMAMNNYFLYQPSLDWDPQPFAVGNLHEQNSTLAMESQMPSEETSTGYLQDVFAEWSSADGGRSKRRRLGAHNQAMNDDFQDLFQDFWDSDFCGSNLDNSGHQLQQDILVSEDPSFNLLFDSNAQTPEYPLQVHQAFNSSPSSSDPEFKIYSKASTKEKMRESKKKKKKVMDLVYPFAVVKPGGLDGDVTLADINARILMRPRRPVRHPVGEYAGRPCVADGSPGLSGKAVASLTRIHTRGRGTITIIRTRG